jgi:hypothetical protein
MKSGELFRIESKCASDFARVMGTGNPVLSGQSADDRATPPRLDLDQAKNGLGQLVLTLVKLIHELLERQAIRRIEAGGLGETDIERLGLTLMRQAEEIERLRIEFGLNEEDLNLDLGPLGKLL